MVREAKQDTQEADSPVPGVKRPVFILGVVSFLTDVSSEMVYPLVPLFLTSVLGAPLAAVGLIEGLAEARPLYLRPLAAGRPTGCGCESRWCSRAT